MSVDEVDFGGQLGGANTEDSLVYPAWSNTVLMTLLDFFENAKHCDLILKFPPNPAPGQDQRQKESQILVHSAVLHANTDYFLNRIQKDGRGHNCVMLPRDLSPRLILPIIYLFYTGKLSIDRNDVTWYEIRTAMLTLKLKNGHNIIELLDYAKLNKAGFSAKGGAKKSGAPRKKAYAEAMIRAKLKATFNAPPHAPGVLQQTRAPNKPPKRTLFKLDDDTSYIMELAPKARITNHRTIIHKILKGNRNLIKPNTAVKLQIKVLKPFGATGAGNTRMETVMIKTRTNATGRLVVELDPEPVPGDDKLPDPDDPLDQFVLKRRMDPTKFVYTGKPGRPRKLKRKRRVLAPSNDASGGTAANTATATAESAEDTGGEADQRDEEEGEGEGEEEEEERHEEGGDMETEEDGVGNLDLGAVLAESGVKIEVVASGKDRMGTGEDIDEDWETEEPEGGGGEGEVTEEEVSMAAVKQEMMEKD